MSMQQAVRLFVYSCTVFSSVLAGAQATSKTPTTPGSTTALPRVFQLNAKMLADI